MEVDENQSYLLKPMNCPHHIQIYKADHRSYRDLPMRLSEFGTVYRLEQSGELSGLIRVRGFTQDDAHIFCTPEQLEAEIESCVELTKLVLETLGLDNYRVRIGLRDPDSEKYIGDSENWDQAEENIRNVVRKVGMEYTEEPGEAAFYGPKIDYFAGAFPLWLAPVQVAVLPVSEKFNEYADKVLSAGRAIGLRMESDESADKIGAKIRRAATQKVPYIFVVGQREVEADTVSVRKRGAGEVGAVALTEAIGKLEAERDSKGAEESNW
jgi:threonyl-tRNA synthetase